MKKNLTHYTNRILVGLVATGLTLSTARAAGLLIADGGLGGQLAIEEHSVDVIINNGIAVTHVTQRFRNLEKRQVEALYTFPIPKQASVANFSMWINGKEMIGEVLEKQRAREIYNSYKRVKRDPGLLEQNDFKNFEMRIFPIAAGAEQRVQVTYYQELEIDHDQMTYLYPLATTADGKAITEQTGKFSISINARSVVPIKSVSSPSHDPQFVMATHSESVTQCSLETTDGTLARDVVLNWDLSRPHTGLDLLTSRSEEEDGYFFVTITAGEDLKKLDTGMDYIFLVDVSGSMANDSKLIMSKRSVDAFVEALGPNDRMELITFNISPKPLFKGLRDVTPRTTQQATEFLGTESARGGTSLKPALDTAYRYSDPDRRLNVVILSDGMTEQRERSQLLALLKQRPSNCRVFCVGVGNEVDKPLLQQLADETGGLAAFVSRGDDFTRQAESFRRKLTRPAARDLTLTISSGVEVYDVVPQKLPDLYHGSPIRIYGRYRGDGQAQVGIAGNVQGVAFKKSAGLPFPEIDPDNPEIERMWAWHRIDQLLREADRKGSRDSVTEAIVALGETYSIVSQYTSFLVLENDAEYRRWKIKRSNVRRLERDRKAQRKVREELVAIRDKAIAEIGPEAARKQAKTPKPTASPVSTSPQVASRQPAPQPTARRRSQSWDFGGGGSGPIGPLFLAALAIAKRFKKRK